MRITVPHPTEIDVAAIRVTVPCRYEDEDIPYDFPHRTGDTWDVTIDLASRKIRDWPAGRAEHVYMKICDEGTYTLLDASGGVLATRENYVPDCIPSEYGDYLDFHIRADGTLEGWEPDADEIVEAFFPAND